MNHHILFAADNDFHARGSGPTFLSAFVALIDNINLHIGDPLDDDAVREVLEHTLNAVDADDHVARRTDFSTPEDNFTIEYITFPDHDNTTTTQTK